MVNASQNIGLKSDTDNAPWSYQKMTQTILDKNGNYVAMIRGWGHLTGKGYAALGLSDEDAIKIQDDRGHRLAKVPEYESEIVRLKEALMACDNYFNSSPAISHEDARENTAKMSVAKTLTRQALTSETGDK